MKVMNHTEEQQTENKTSLSNGAKRNRIFIYIAIAGVIAAVITAAFTGYYLHQERAEEKKQEELLKAEKAKKQKEKKAKTTETAEQKLERVRSQAEEQGVPQSVIELLDKNAETVDFVADYEKKKDKPYADTIEEDLSNGEIPELLQWDERWGYAPYGTGIVATSGCGPTCMAMVAAGLNQDASITPAKVAAYGTEHGYVDEENNTYWRFMDEAGANWNLNSVGGMLSEEQVSAELAQGHPVGIPIVATMKPFKRPISVDASNEISTARYILTPNSTISFAHKILTNVITDPVPRSMSPSKITNIIPTEAIPHTAT